jgi:thiamine biosynthesis lipoprotein
MGTVVGVDIRQVPRGAVVEPALDAFFATLREIEARFSPFLPDSEISRIADSRLAEADATFDVRFVLAACDHLAETSGGAFDARHHRADGRLDPSGFVKGWAIDEASHHLDDAGLRSYAINAGGDVLACGSPDGSRGWLVGIQHPWIRDRVAARLETRSGAVATSGLYERGDHIRDPRSGATPAELLSLTVVGPELTWSDAYATAAFAMGLEGLAWVERQPGYGAIAITADDRLVWSPAVAPLLTNIS